MEVAIIVAASCEENLLALQVLMEVIKHAANLGVRVLLAFANVDEVNVGATISELFRKVSHVVVRLDDLRQAQRLRKVVEICVNTHKHWDIIMADQRRRGAFEQPS